MEREDSVRNTIKKSSENQPQKMGFPPIPNDWKCSITGEIMFDPVIVSVSGRSYEREALERWLQTHNTDPQTNQVIPKDSYFPNQGLQSTIVQFAKFIPSMWEGGEETIYKSERHYDNVWNAAGIGNEAELSRWLELDPRVVYEERKNTTLLEFLSSDKKRIVCIQRVIGHVEHNPLGGFERLRKIIKDSKALFFNLAKCDGQERTIANEMIKKLSVIMGWNEKIYREYYFEACEKGLVNILSAFMWNFIGHIPLDSYDEKGRTALHLAVENNQVAVVQWLISTFQEKYFLALFPFLLAKQKNANTTERKTIFEMLNPQSQIAKIIKVTLGEEKEYGLFSYANSNSVDASQLKMLAQVLNWDSNFYQCVAKKAVLSGHIDILEKSLSLGAKIDHHYPEQEGKTLLHLAAIFASNWQAKVSIFQNSDTYQALLRTLLNYNAPINAQDNSGKTVLHVAAIQCAEEIFFKILLGCKGIDIWIPDNEEEIAIEYLLDSTTKGDVLQISRLRLLAQAYNKEALFEYLLSKYPLKEELRIFFAEIKLDESIYQHSAFKCAEKGRPDELQDCLGLGVKPDAQGQKAPYEGQYLLATAIVGGLECVKLLLDRGANINVRTKDNNTLLHEAVRHQKLDVAYELLERGLGISNRKGKAENAQGQTAEEYAEHLGYMPLATAIRERRKQIKYRPFIKQETQALEKKVQNLEEALWKFQHKEYALAPLFQMFKADKKLLRPINIGTHDNDIYAIVQHQSYLISGGRDSLIKIWNMNDYTCMSILKDHKGTIFSFELIQPRGRAHIPQYLASASSDKTIKIWNLEDPKNISCVTTLAGHDGCVDAIAELPNKHLVSGSRSGMIKIWDLNNLDSPQCVVTFMAESGVETLVTLPSGKNNSIYFASNAADEIKIWDATDLKSPKCLSTLKEHARFRVRSLTLIENQLISASADKTIKVWDISDPQNPQFIATLVGHTGDVTRLVKLPNGHLASASTDKTIKIWDLNTKKCVATLETQQEIWGLATTFNGNIVTGEAKNSDQDDKQTFDIQLWSRAHFMPAQSLIEEVEQAVPECKQM